MPPKEHDYAFSKAASVVQINGEGPFDITYINAADDPQRAPSADALRELGFSGMKWTGARVFHCARE